MGLLLPLLGRVPCGTLQRTRYYLNIKTHTFADLCDFHYTWANSHEGEQITGDTGTTRDHRSVTRRKFGLGASRGGSS